MVLIPFKAGQWFKHRQCSATRSPARVLIPFKAGQWFKQDGYIANMSYTVVLIPFKAGQWFKQFPILLHGVGEGAVLIPFKAGQWFKHRLFRAASECGSLNPF